MVDFAQTKLPAKVKRIIYQARGISRILFAAVIYRDRCATNHDVVSCLSRRSSTMEMSPEGRKAGGKMETGRGSSSLQLRFER